MKIYCPKHPKQTLNTLVYQVMSQEKKKKGIKQGAIMRTKWLYCSICDKPYKPKVSFTN